MTDLSSLPSHGGEAPATRNGAVGRICRRHRRLAVHFCTDPGGVGMWHVEQLDSGQNCEPGIICTACWKRLDPVASRRGRNNRKRGLAIQLEVARTLGLENLQGNGPIDARDASPIYGNAAFVAQVKSGAKFPGWMSDELAKLPTTGDRTPILAVAETGPHGARRRRVLAVLDAADWCALHRGEPR